MSETLRGSPGHVRGARPIRKRAYWRALKRGEPWAVMKMQMREMLKAVSQRAMFDFLKPSPWEKVVTTTQDGRESMPIIKVTYEKKK